MRIVVVMTANRVSLIGSALGWFLAVRRGIDPPLEGELLGDSTLRLGRHLRTASTDALQGWTWSGYENITMITMAVLPIVDATAGVSKVI